MPGNSLTLPLGYMEQIYLTMGIKFGRFVKFEIFFGYFSASTMVVQVPASSVLVLVFAISVTSDSIALPILILLSISKKKN